MSHDLIVAHLTKRYGNLLALDEVSFSIAAGEIFGILGKNGAGKTTAIECIIGLRTADAGDIHVCGLDARTDRPRIRQMIGVQLQSTALQDKITPREALNLFASFYGNKAAVPGLIDRFSLGEKADSHFDVLSGGQRQRLALALALVNQPRVLFLDEPTAGLDAQSRRELQQMIRQMKADGRTVLLSTHDMDEAQTLCDHIAVIDHGRVIADGSPGDLITAAGGLSRLTFRTAFPLNASLLSPLAGVRHVEQNGQKWLIQTDHVSGTLAQLAPLLEAAGNPLLDLQVKQPTLEDFFVGITAGKAGRRA